MNQLNAEAILNAKQFNQAVVFKNVFDNMPDWDMFINQIDASSKLENTYHADAMMKSVGKVHWWHQLTATIDDAQSMIPAAKINLEAIASVYPISTFGNTSFSVVSFTTTEPTTSLHYDQSDVFYWQCIGKVNWHVGKRDEEKQVFELVPGDLIYVPSWKHHEVFSLTPRAAISFQFYVNETDPHHKQ